MLMARPSNQKTDVRADARAIAILFLAFLIVSPLALAQSRRGGEQQSRRSGPGTGDPDEHLVPWQFLDKGGPLVKGVLVLYWLPASVDEIKHSPLRSSRVLLRDLDRCLGLEVILPDDAAMIDKLGAKGKLPAAYLLDSRGEILRRIESPRGGLRAAAVEQMVTDELAARDEAMYARITEARRRSGNGDKDGAIDLYRKLWDERCLYPFAGTEAQRALKDLGVVVVEPAAAKPVVPAPPVAPPTKTVPPGHPARH
jgi:hypothetical protein